MYHLGWTHEEGLHANGCEQKFTSKLLHSVYLLMKSCDVQSINSNCYTAISATIHRPGYKLGYNNLFTCSLHILIKLHHERAKTLMDLLAAFSLSSETKN